MHLKVTSLFKMHKIIFFSQKKINKICVPTLPKIFRPGYPKHTKSYCFVFGLTLNIAQNKHIFLVFLFVCLDSLRPSQFFSPVETGLSALNLCLAEKCVLLKETTQFLQ